MRVAVAGGTGVVGRHVVAALAATGHDPVVLARSTGVDLLAGGTGVASALEGCAAVVDVTSVVTTSGTASTRFFGTITANLLAAGRQARIPHHIALSIIGAADNPAGYYAGKAEQERLLRASGDGWTILRATQFHEFAAQIAARRIAGLHVVPAMTSQPVAAAEVGARLAAIATAAPAGLARDLGGPRVEDMPTLVRRYLRATGARGRVLAVPLPGRWGRALRDGSTLPGPDAELGTQTFDEWLAAL